MEAWSGILDETESLEKQPRKMSEIKFHDEELKSYIEKYPDSILSDITKKFLRFNLWGIRCFEVRRTRSGRLWDR